MSDALTSSIAPSPPADLRLPGAPAAPSPVAAQDESLPRANPNAPAYVSPAVTFDPETNIVVLTYRNPETGKVREQYPPSVVVDRYREAERTGVPDPTLPRTTPAAAGAAPADESASGGGGSPPLPDAGASGSGSPPQAA
jgi:hypothetical protein